jgi:hypothetical protein
MGSMAKYLPGIIRYLADNQQFTNNLQVWRSQNQIPVDNMMTLRQVIFWRENCPLKNIGLRSPFVGLWPGG